MKLYYPTDKDGNKISLNTSEKSVFDENGVCLHDKLKGILEIVEETSKIDNLSHITTSVDKNTEDIALSNERLNTIESEVDELKKFVSDSKKLVADAITSKGTVTAATETFDSMITKIRSISSSSIRIDGTIENNMLAYIKSSLINDNDITKYSRSFASFPSGYTFEKGTALMHKGKMYALGLTKSDDTYNKNRCFVYNSSTSSWNEIASIPINATSNYKLRAVSLYDYIYIFKNNYMYRYDESSNTWSSVNTLSMNVVNNYSISVFNDKICLPLITKLDSNTIKLYIYAYTTTGSLTLHSITASSTNTVNDGIGSSVVTSDGLHVFRSGIHLVVPGNTIGSTLTVKNNLPMPGNKSSEHVPVVINDEIYVFTELTTSDDIPSELFLYKYNKTNDSWKEIGNTFIKARGCSVVYNPNKKKVYLLGGNSTAGTNRTSIEYEADFTKTKYTIDKIISK